jgi:hypothetical protein
MTNTVRVLMEIHFFQRMLKTTLFSGFVCVLSLNKTRQFNSSHSVKSLQINNTTKFVLSYKGEFDKCSQIYWPLKEAGDLYWIRHESPEMTIEIRN